MSDFVVIKVGGSLLSEPGALIWVRDWLNATRREGETRLLLAGGGAAVDALRLIDAANCLSADAAHWTAIRIMDAHTRLLTEWLPTLRITTALPAAGPSNGDFAFLCEPFLRDIEPRQDGERLKISWKSTSDAIAARLAEVVGARLVLLKHTLEATYPTLSDASTAGVIDAETPRHAASLSQFDLIGVIYPGTMPSNRS